MRSGGERHWRLGFVQDVAPDGVRDLAPGYLGPDLLPLTAVGAAYRAALEEYGPSALTYGHDAGALVLRQQLAARAAAVDGVPCAAEQVVVTAGTSSALQLLATTLASPGDVVLVDALSYDLGRRIFEDDGLDVLRVAGDPVGMDPVALAVRLNEVRSEGRRVAFLYLTPTFANPLGTTLPITRRLALHAVASSVGVLVVEDDAYCDTAIDAEPVPPSVAALSGYQGVVRLGTFSKTLGAGLRLGWMVTDEERAARLTGHGLLASGGCLNHITSLAVSTMLTDGTYDRHVRWLGRRLRERRDALLHVLGPGLGNGAKVTVPGGGLFSWVQLPPPLSEPAALAAAAGAGVRVSAGSRFGTTPTPSVRLSYSYCVPGELAAAAHLLVEAWRRP